MLSSILEAILSFLYARFPGRIQEFPRGGRLLEEGTYRLEDPSSSLQTQLETQAIYIQILLVMGITLLCILLVSFYLNSRKDKAVSKLLHEAESRLQKQRSSQELMQKKIHERSRDHLHMLASILDLELIRQTSDEIRLPLHKSLSRIKVLALIHQHAFHREGKTFIELRPFVQALMRSLLIHVQEDRREVILECDMGKIELDLDRTLAVGVILNELLTNTLEHGFANDQPGKITIQAYPLPQVKLAIEITDNGQGIPESKWEEAGVGLSLVQILVRKMRGSLHRTSSQEGTTYRIIIPPSKRQHDWSGVKVS
ncbi:MAG: sensor histidine kinase [Bacteroidota bacterium]